MNNNSRHPIIVFEDAFSNELKISPAGVPIPKDSIPVAVITGDGFQVANTLRHSSEEIVNFVQRNTGFKYFGELENWLDINELLEEDNFLPEEMPIEW